MVGDEPMCYFSTYEMTLKRLATNYNFFRGSTNEETKSAGWLSKHWIHLWHYRLLDSVSAPQPKVESTLYFLKYSLFIDVYYMDIATRY